MRWEKRGLKLLKSEEKVGLATHLADIQRIIRECREQSHTNKSGNLDEIDRKSSYHS